MNNTRLMRRLTIGGVAIAVATLLTALAVVEGFGNAYERALLDFNAHIVVTADTEFAGGDDVRAAEATMDRYRAAAPEAGTGRR
ncbi:MAG: hypothetical protein HY543_07355, partial [Deltaproteobacteria bacterium]|nr:hypothetical protein [Deltaproteobacteria bacterium]